MSWRRAVALLLLVCISVSSAEVLWAEAVEASAEEVGPTDVVLADVADSSLAPAPTETPDSDDCTCLCACACPGAQTVVLPHLPTFQPTPVDAPRPLALVEHTPVSAPVEPHFRPPLA